MNIGAGKHSIKILYLGTLEWGSTSLQRFESLQMLPAHVYGVDMRLFLEEYVRRSAWTRIQLRLSYGPLIARIASGTLREALRFRPDILWVDQGICLSAEALRRIRINTQSLLVHYTPDSLTAPGFGNPCFRKAVPEYDLCITTKENDGPIYSRLGAKRIFLSYKGYDPRIHRPISMNDEDLMRFSCDVAFSGQRMKSRAQSLCFLLEKVPCQLHLYGRHWEKGRTGRILGRYQKGWVYGDDYCRSIVGAKIFLAFLNREVCDAYTTRSVEIPACRGFMLAERTQKHCELFRENEEAVFFSSDQEMVDKIRYYLDHEEERLRIANAGYERITHGGYSWEDLMRGCFESCQRLLAQQNRIFF
jgi:spore maturation protein CgeB